MNTMNNGVSHYAAVLGPKTLPASQSCPGGSEHVLFRNSLGLGGLVNHSDGFGCAFIHPLRSAKLGNHSVMSGGLAIHLAETG